MAVFSGNGSATAPSFTFSSDTNLGIYRGGTDIISFTTAGSERSRIDASGNLEIGGTLGSAPNIELSVDGTGKFSSFVESTRFSGTRSFLSGELLGTDYGILVKDDPADTIQFAVSTDGRSIFSNDMRIGMTSESGTPQITLNASGTIQSGGARAAHAVSGRFGSDRAAAGAASGFVDCLCDVWSRG